MLKFRQTSTLLFRLTACWLLATTMAWAQAPAVRQTTGFLPRVFKDDSGNHKYMVFVPRGYTPARKWPVILFLHGAGERGNDGVLPTQVGLGPLIRLREASFPFVVVFPQAEEMHGRLLKGWLRDTADTQRALKILEQVEKDFSIDTKREILTGWSMGGFGAWDLAAAFPERWHAVVPVSGGGEEAWGEPLKNVPLWAWHGAKDKMVPPERSQKMIAAVKAAGGQPRYSEPADGDHNAWKTAYDDDSLYAWMLNPQGDPAKLAAVTARARPAPGQPPLPIPEPPFVPALDIPRAAYARLGNEMLASLADSIPQVIPREALVGRLSDISDMTEAQGYTFSVYMYGLSYQAQVARASVRAYRKDRLNIQLGLTNVVVTIGGTSLNGQRHSAQAGPMNIVMGHVRPIWLSFDVTPEVVDRKLHFRHVGTNFSIPHDNWYVTAPAGVSTQGWGMTEDKVSNGLVSGLYSRKYTMEQKVAGVIPRLIAELEKKVDVGAAARSATGIWPLPAYQPRLRFWPAEVSTDEQGVTLVLGATAAAINPSKPPRQVRAVPPLGLPASAIPQSTKLLVGLAPQMLAPLSEMLVEADVGRVPLADVPSNAMAKLADPAVVAEAIPDLKRYGSQLDIFSELVLTGPINVVDGPAFDARQAKILISMRTEKSAAYKPCVDLDVTLRQLFAPKLIRPKELTRAVELAPEGPSQVEIKGRFAGGYEPQEPNIDTERLQSLFAAGWDDFISTGGPPRADIPDIDLGYTKLRAADAGWKAPDVFAVFGPPGVKITNTSEKALVYETKGPYSGWGGPYTLKPGATHDFPITYPMLFRRRVGNTYQMFTLPVGSHSEFRAKTPGAPESLYQAREPAEIQKAVEDLPPPPADKK
ncbi:MAG: alpha/beta hydrolase-fold protein [Deltaproteobacteria bacterium]